MVNVSVTILNNNSSKETLSCIKSVLDSYKYKSYEVIVVDNGNNNSLEKIISNKYNNIIYLKTENKGYGAGNNFGVRHAKGKYILILNPDCRVSKNTIRTLSDILSKNHDVAAVSPNLINDAGKIFSQLGSRQLTPIRGIFALSFINKLFPNNPISRSYYLKDKDMNELREVDCIPGSAFMIKKSVFDEVGGFDENMFLYFEESDLGIRIKKLGYKLFITPVTQVMHRWNVDSKNKKLKEAFIKSRFYYFRKHYGILNALIVEGFCRISKYNLLISMFLILLIIVIIKSGYG